jgi:hypothetical protein
MHWTFSRIATNRHGTRTGWFKIEHSNRFYCYITQLQRQPQIQNCRDQCFGQDSTRLEDSELSQLTQSQSRDSNYLIINSASRLYLQSGALNLQLLYNQ